MVNNPKALWDNCLSLIKDNVTEQQYKTWFAPIVFEKYDEEHQSVLVQVPSMYVYEYLEQYYVNLLSKVLTRCFGQKVQLNYRVVTDKQHRINTVVEGEEPTSVEPAPATNRANKAPTTLDVVERDLNPQLETILRATAISCHAPWDCLLPSIQESRRSTPSSSLVPQAVVRPTLLML